jgi:hypothetical protein
MAKHMAKYFPAAPFLSVDCGLLLSLLVKNVKVAKKKVGPSYLWEGLEAISIQTSVLVMPDHQDLVFHPVAIDTILTIILATPRPRKESLPSCFWTWT